MPTRRIFFPFIVLVTALLAACGGGGGGGTPENGGGGGAPRDFKITATDPAAFQENVYVGATISATFNAPVDMGSVGPTTFSVIRTESMSGPIAGSYSYNAASYTVTFKPSASLAYNADYAVMITGVRSSGGATVADHVARFTTQANPDTVPPVTTASPTGGRYKDVFSVTLTCDDAGGTGCANTYYTTNGSNPTTSSTAYSGPIAIDSTTTLKFFSTDVAGNAEAVKTEQYVIDRTPPTVVAVAPAADSTAVNLTEAITATFSEAMNPATMADGVLLVDNGVAGTLDYDELTHTLTFTPHERLACNTPHTATVTTAAQDVAGNPLESSFSWSFTTATDCDEPVTTANSAGGVFTAEQMVTLTCTDIGSGCARIVYTTDGSAPSFDPVNGTANGTVVDGGSAGPIAIREGDTTVRFFAQDHAGNQEVLRQLDFSVSTTGFTFAATNGGLSRGVGAVPTQYVNITSNGRTYDFFLDESNGRLYRVSGRGLFVSDDQGGIWKALSLPSVSGYPPSVSTVFARGSKILAGTQDGLYASVDGGATFELRPSGVYDTDSVSAVHVSGHRVYVATYGGLLISDDKGYTFSHRSTADGLGSNRIRSMLVRDDALYLGTEGGLSVSTDGGETFTNITTDQGLGSNQVNAVAMSADGATLYVGTSGGLSISTDSGTSFQTRTTADGLGEDNVVEILPTGGYLYVATGVTYVSSTTRPLAVSTDGGASFVSRAVARDSSDVHVHALLQLDDRLLVGAYPAYYESTDQGTTFEPKEFPLGSFKKVQYANGRLYATVADSSGFGGIVVSDDLGATFDYRYEAHGLGNDRIDDLVVAGNAVYAGSWMGLSISTDAGETFDHLSKFDSSVGLPAGADTLHVNGATVLAGYNNGLARSTNGGYNFTDLLTGTGSTSDVVASGSNIYLATTSGLRVSTNDGASFVLRTTADGLPDHYLNAVAVSGDAVFVGCLNQGLAISLDGGETFTSSPGLSTGGVYALEAIGGRLYAATSQGVAISTDNGQSFVLRTEADGLGWDSVNHVYYVLP